MLVKIVRIGFFITLVASSLPPNDQIIQEWQAAWIKILNKLNNNKLVLRDFHADNLFWLPDRSNIRKIGLIDFQDALIGNEAYDISSLLEDVRRDVSKKTKEISIQKFIDLNKINDDPEGIFSSTIEEHLSYQLKKKKLFNNNYQIIIGHLKDVDYRKHFFSLT